MERRLYASTYVTWSTGSRDPLRPRRARAAPPLLGLKGPPLHTSSWGFQSCCRWEGGDVSLAPAAALGDLPPRAGDRMA